MSTKNIYVIQTNQTENQVWSLGYIAFVISSKKKANEQMDVIYRMTNNGEWFVGSDKTYEVINDRVYPDGGNLNILREIIIRCKETGERIAYRLSEMSLNSTYIPQSWNR